MNKSRLFLRIFGLGEARAEGMIAILVLSVVVLVAIVVHASS
jgi:hypothetical protein